MPRYSASLVMLMLTLAATANYLMLNNAAELAIANMMANFEYQTYVYMLC